MMIELSGADLAQLLIIVLIVALGVGALLAGMLRRRTAARALILFGLFSLLHGTRVAASLPVVDLIPGLSPRALDHIRSNLTYLVLLPLMLLVEQFVGRGWRGTMHATLWLQAAYSTVGILTDIITGTPGVIMVVKPYVVLVIGTIALGNTLFAAWRTSDIPPVLVVGFMSFLATVGLYNFDQIVHRQIPQSIETFGFVALLLCLAYAVAVRTIDTEARLLSIEREIQTAQRIQTSILPQEPPAIPGLTIAVRYRPMATMAGDFYDFVRIDDTRLAILVADVSGHGLAASLIASMVKVALKAEAVHGADPGAVLSGMNETLVGLLGRDRDYVTACYVVVHPAAGEICFGDAGHPPSLLQSPDGHISTLDTGGTILGQFTSARFEGVRRTVDPHSRLLLYTDGVTEAMNPAGEFFGLDRVRAFMNERCDTTADQFADALFETITAWRGGAKLDDDVTIAVVDM
jgi:hypothetical protein